MIFVLGILTGIVISFLFGLYRFIANNRGIDFDNRSFVRDILSTNDGIDFARKFLYTNWPGEGCKLLDNEVNKKFKLYAQLKDWYENC